MNYYYKEKDLKVKFWDATIEEIKDLVFYKSEIAHSLENIVINGQLYSCHCTRKHGDDKFIMVEELNIKKSPADTKFKDEITCPFCSYEVRDSWEMSDDDEIDCNGCGSQIRYRRIVDVSYNCEPVKLNNEAVVV